MLEIITAVGSEIIDLAVGKIVDRLGDHLEPQMRLIEQRLETIEEKVERELAIHLNAALIFLQSKARQSARHELVMAVAADPHAAAAKFWYAVVLYMDGERELARNEYTKALLLNPFLGQNAGSAPDALHGLLEYHAPLVTWTVKLNDKTFIKKYLWSNWIRRQLTSWWGGSWGFRGFAAIEKVSCSGGNPVVFWRVGSDLSWEYKHFLSAFDLASGTCLWNQPADGELCFATPRVVAFKSAAAGGSYRLLDLGTGNVIARMGAEYYRTIFCPDEDRLSQIPMFVQSNLTMSDAESCSEKISANRQANLQKKDAIDRFVGATDPLEEIGTARNPFGGDAYRIRAANKWDIHRFVSANTPPSSALGCDAEISHVQ